MKKIIFLFFSLFITFFFLDNAIAQDKPIVAVSSVKQNGKNVDFTLTSSKPFIFGNNRYILYIGDKEIFLNKQSQANGKGTMTFFIPADDFNGLQEGLDIYLTYGQVFSKRYMDREAISKQNRLCWSLGKFNPALLTK